jgi:hypothetical protein
MQGSPFDIILPHTAPQLKDIRPKETLETPKPQARFAT